MKIKPRKKILLLDVDSKYPNIALMKISGFYKKQGYDIELRELHYNFFKINKKRCCINARGFDKVFGSILFTTNRYKVFVINCKEVEFGGTGYDLEKKLPKEIDDFEEDYSIYNEKGYSYGFLTRGCIRNCKFCVVPKKEGMIHRYREVNQIVKHPKVRFYDNNILAWKGWKEIFQELIDKNICCTFSQGLDIRELTEEKARMIRKLNYFDYIYFAFDDIKLKEIISKKYEILKKYFKPWSIRFYVYCNAKQSIRDLLSRVLWCKKNQALVYLMRDINCVTSKDKVFFSNLARYCYCSFFFKTRNFVDFIVYSTKIKDEDKKKILNIYKENSPINI